MRIEALKKQRDGEKCKLASEAPPLVPPPAPVEPSKLDELTNGVALGPGSTEDTHVDTAREEPDTFKSPEASGIVVDVSSKTLPNWSEITGSQPPSPYVPVKVEPLGDT